MAFFVILTLIYGILLILFSSTSVHGQSIRKYDPPVASPLHSFETDAIQNSTQVKVAQKKNEEDTAFRSQSEQEMPRVLEKKGHIQDLITQRDMEKEKRIDIPFYKKWFAELLAAFFIFMLVIVFVCWYTISKRGEHRDRIIKSGMNRNIASGIGMTVRHMQFIQDQTVVNRAIVPEMQSLSLKPLKPLKCPKSACVCSSDIQRKGKRKWNYKEDNEPYAPAAV